MTQRPGPGPFQPLTALDDALALIASHVRHSASRTLPVAGAIGRVLAADCVAPLDIPARAVAARDGWAVAAADMSGATPASPVMLRHEPSWIEAGDVVPDGVDTVLPPEAVVPGPIGFDVVSDAAAGDGVRQGAEDCGAGQTLARAGDVLPVAALLALVAAGVRAVAVRVPRVRIVVGADTRNAASTAALAAFLAPVCRTAGVDVATTVTVGRGVDAIAAALMAGDGESVMLIGGSGYGRHDGSVEAVAKAGTVHLHGIALRPGDTAAFGEAAGRPVLVVPGCIDAGLAAVLALGVPILRAMSGLAQQSPTVIRALSRKIVSPIGMSEVVFVRCGTDNAEPLGGDGLPLSMLASANGWVLVPHASEGFAGGANVKVMPL